jgi:hypothetical protein
LDSVLSKFGKIWKVDRVELLLKRMFGCRLVLMAVCAGNQLKLRVCDKILIGIAQPSFTRVTPGISRSFSPTAGRGKRTKKLVATRVFLKNYGGRHRTAKAPATL